MYSYQYSYIVHAMLRYDMFAKLVIFITTCKRVWRASYHTVGGQLD